MAAIFDTIDEGLKRTTGLIPANQEFYTATWWVYFQSWPSVGVIRTFYMVANSADRTNQSISIIQDDTGKISLRVGTTLYGGQVFPPGWHSIGIRRRPNSNFIDFDVNDDSVPVGSATITFSGWTFNELYLGVDPRINGATQQVAYFREWTDFLSYLAEWRNPVPKITVNLSTDTPFETDLLDKTVNHHDWIKVGGGVITFATEPTAIEGSMGGWWFYSNYTIAANDHECIMRIESMTSGFIAEVVVDPMGFTSVGDVPTIIDYEIRLRYFGSTSIVTLISANPIVDPATGLDMIPVPPRNTYAIPWRFALLWKCSTWNYTTSTFAADGFVKLYLNENLLLSAINVTIPRRSEGGTIQYIFGVRGDCDRIWARTVAQLPAINTEGGFVSGLPSALVYFEEFDNGLYPFWQETELYGGGGGFTPTPNVYNNCGGDNGWGLSVYANDPNAVGSNVYVPYSGLLRKIQFPPMSLTALGQGPPVVIPPDLGGIYFINPVKTTKRDTYFNDGTGIGVVEKKIPDPIIKTAIIGE